MFKIKHFLDVNIGGILDLISLNAERNKNLMKSQFIVTELDFTKEFTNEITKELSSVDLIFAADGNNNFV